MTATGFINGKTHLRASVNNKGFMKSLYAESLCCVIVL